MIRGGWTGRILRVDLSSEKHTVQNLDAKDAVDLLGGRGLAVKILWDELRPGTDPFSPENRLIFATGPLTGFALPSSGKLVIAAKSPLTGGYGDGNIGTRASVQLRKAGYDLIVVQGKAKEPSLLYVEDDSVEIKSATDLWGRNAYEVQDLLEEEYGKVGILVIGPGGEKLVRFAVVVSEKGRAGGRTGMGAVMGSKNLKAVVIKGTKEIPAINPEGLKEMAKEGYAEIKAAENYDFWVRQGTMATIEWSQANSVLPTYNFREGVFDEWEGISGSKMEEYKVSQKGCPFCNMQCGMQCEIRDGPYKGEICEVDYENIGMLGSNLGIGDFDWALNLNLLADKEGIDTITLGSVLGFATECMEKGLLSKEEVGIDLKWGDGQAMFELAEMVASRKGIGDQMAEGVKRFSAKIGHGSEKFAMHVKGLEITAYDCHAAPGMALAFGTSPIGSHHKDAWFIAWELKMGRDLVTKEKVERLIEMQRIRGGFFESAVTCRLPWIELAFNLEWYPKYLKAATGLDYTLQDLWLIADRIYNLVRAFWIRENPNWSREMDYPPARWFEEPLTKGPLKGTKIDKGAYDQLLSWYYEIRGWDERGIPTKSTLKKSGLDYVIDGLEAVGVSLSQ